MTEHETQQALAKAWDAGKVAGILAVTAPPGTFDPQILENPYRVVSDAG